MTFTAWDAVELACSKKPDFHLCGKLPIVAGTGIL
jgi:hypothetical protein